MKRLTVCHKGSSHPAPSPHPTTSPRTTQTINKFPVTASTPASSTLTLPCTPINRSPSAPHDPPPHGFMRDFHFCPFIHPPDEFCASRQARRRRSSGITRIARLGGCEDGDFSRCKFNGCGFWYRGCGDVRNALVMHDDLARPFN
jgi:hypothetical protein